MVGEGGWPFMYAVFGKEQKLGLEQRAVGRRRLHLLFELEGGGGKIKWALQPQGRRHSWCRLPGLQGRLGRWGDGAVGAVGAMGFRGFRTTIRPIRPLRKTALPTCTTMHRPGGCWAALFCVPCIASAPTCLHPSPHNADNIGSAYPSARQHSAGGGASHRHSGSMPRTLGSSRSQQRFLLAGGSFTGARHARLWLQRRQRPPAACRCRCLTGGRCGACSPHAERPARWASHATAANCGQHQQCFGVLVIVCVWGGGVPAAHMRYRYIYMRFDAYLMTCISGIPMCFRHDTTGASHSAEVSFAARLAKPPNPNPVVYNPHHAHARLSTFMSKQRARSRPAPPPCGARRCPRAPQPAGPPPTRPPPPPPVCHGLHPMPSRPPPPASSPTPAPTARLVS